MIKKKTSAALCAALLCLTLAACGAGAKGGTAAAAQPSTAAAPAAPVSKAPPVVFAAGSVPSDSAELRMPLSDGETALLASLPNLAAADFSGSRNEEESAAWAMAEPGVEC